MAQSVERVLGKDEVTGSNPVSSSIKRTQTKVVRSFFISRTYQGQEKGLPKIILQGKRILGKRGKTIEKGVCKSKRNKKAYMRRHIRFFDEKICYKIVFLYSDGVIFVYFLNTLVK